MGCKMTGYINSLIAVIALCALVLRLAPSSGSTGKYIKVVASLIVLATLLTPVRTLFTDAHKIGERITALFDIPRESAEKRDEYAPAAAALLSYIGEHYPEVGAGNTVTFVTDEDGNITEAQFFLPNADGRLCDRVEREIGGELSVTVKVFGGVNRDGEDN